MKKPERLPEPVQPWRRFGGSTFIHLATRNYFVVLTDVSHRLGKIEP